LSGLHFETNDFAKSIPLSERALAIDERTLDQNDPLFRHDVEMLAMIFEAAGRHGDAQALLKAQGFNIEKIN
jgi:hypothetical protein